MKKKSQAEAGRDYVRLNREESTKVRRLLDPNNPAGKRRRQIVNVEHEVRQIEQRVRSSEAINYMILRVQQDTLKQAEKIRLAARDLMRSRRKDPLTGFTVLSGPKIYALEDALKDVEPFYRERRMPKAVRRFMEKMSKKR